MVLAGDSASHSGEHLLLFASMLGGPFSAWPSFTTEESEAVSRVLLSNRVNYWTGNEGREFEREFAGWAHTSHAVAVANGTVGLDLAWQALELETGDEVVVSPRTFVASATSVLNCGASPVFADIDRDSQNITADSIARVLSPRTKAILCVHLAGWPCDMESISALAADHNLRIVEDCAQAHGALYAGKPVGSHGDIGAWSFCQDKIMSTGGEGGMVTTNNPDLWSRLWSYKDHGKSWEAVYEREHPVGFRWLHEGRGTNWRLTELQAAIGRIQLRRMPQWHAARTGNAAKILLAAESCPILRVPTVPATIEHAWYKCYVFIRPEMLRRDWSRDRLISEISQREVPCFSGSCSEVYLERVFDGTPHRPLKRLQTAKELGETSLMFLVHPTLTSSEIDKTCQVLRDVAALALR